VKLEFPSHNQALITLPHEVNMANSKELKQLLVSALEQGCTDVTLDFSHVTMIDSSGISKMLLFQKKFKERGGGLKIVSVNNAYVKKVFRMLQLDKCIEIQPQLQDNSRTG